MKTRVTITLDPAIHLLAKRTARKRRTTVSGLIESLLQTKAAATKQDLVAGMTGSARLRTPAPGSDQLFDVLQAKYLRK